MASPVVSAIAAHDGRAAIAGQLAATYRGRLYPSRASASPAPSAAAATPPAPPPPPAPVAHIAQTTASGAMATLQPRPTDSGSQWSTGVDSYDGSGNITQIGTDAYVYDRLGRVASGTAGSGKQQSYTYDRYGNITTITTAANPAPIVRQLGVDATTNQASNSALAYDLHGTYDAAGNVRTWSTGESFDYDGLGMVREATLDGAKKLYIYSASDERIATISMTNGIETDSMWTIRDTSGKVLRRLQKTGAGSAATWTWKQDYIYRGNQLLAAETDGPEHTLHFHPDHLGTPRLIPGNGGAKVSLHDYYPFGEEATDPLQDTERLKFTSHERDTARLDYMHARYYNPTAGRFLSVNPKRAFRPAAPLTWNRYSYVAGNPLKYLDPDGRDLHLAFDFRESGLTVQERGQVMAHVRSRFSAAGVQVITLNEQRGLAAALNHQRYLDLRVGLTAERVPSDRSVEVQVVNFDLSPMNPNGVFGMAEDGDRAALVSTHDMRSLSRPQFLTALTNVIAHEIGHATGALPEHANDGMEAPAAARGSIMDQGTAAERGQQLRFFDPADAELLRTRLNP